MPARRSLPRPLLKIALAAACLLAFTHPSAIAQITLAQNQPTPPAERVSFQRTALPMIPAGTRFDERPPQGWSDLISLVHNKLSSGDVDAVSDTVRYYAELFHLVVLANADQNDDGNYELDKVAIGFSMRIQGVNTVVTPATQADLGGKLSLIGRGVLAGNVDSLKNVQQVARTHNSLVFDAPAIILWQGRHRQMVLRYYVWVFPKNGNLGVLAWLLEHSPDGSRLQVADGSLQLLPTGQQEHRVLNVDAEKFNLLGIPSKEAFALTQIPQGIAFEMNQAMLSLAAEKTFTPTTFSRLISAIADTLKTGSQQGP